MRVDSPNDRAEAPDECDCCEYPTQLTRHVSYGPGHHVDWLCRFCQKTNRPEPTLCALFNELLTAIREQPSRVE